MNILVQLLERVRYFFVALVMPRLGIVVINSTMKSEMLDKNSTVSLAAKTHRSPAPESQRQCD